MTTAMTQEDEMLATRASQSVRSREKDFEAALVHSGKVRILKWVLPTIGILCILAFGVYTFLSRVPQLSYDLAGVAFSDGKLVMSSPKLNGMTNDDLPYSLTARSATQNPTTQNIIELHGIDADVPIDAKDRAHVVAEHGIYDSSANTLVLDTPVDIKGTNGLQANLKSARLEVDGGKMTTGDPVEILLNGNRITSDTFSVLENGKILVFEKRVRLNIAPQSKNSASTGVEDASN